MGLLSVSHIFTQNVYGCDTRGGYKEEDLLEAARFVEKYTLELKATNVLELATGRGANSSYLALKFPSVNFFGLDISKGQLDYAFKSSKKIKNYHPSLGDYHDLSRFPNNHFEIVFVVEALCYSTEKEKVLREVHRVLKKGGVFIIFDGYISKKDNELTQNELLAKKLTERGMAVSRFETYKEFLEKVRKGKFRVVYEENVSQYILPTLYRFERLSEGFFRKKLLAKVIKRTFPKEFVNNSISGLLMPELVKLKLGLYYITILKK